MVDCMVMLPRNFHKIDRFQVETIDSISVLQSFPNTRNFKILVIKDFPRSLQGLTFINSHAFRSSFYSYLYAFVIVIKCTQFSSSVEEELAILNLCFSKNSLDQLKEQNTKSLSRPLLICIELESESARRFYFKSTSDDFCFYETSNCRSYHKNAFTDFKKLMDHLSFNRSFLDTTVNVDGFYNDMRLIDIALKTNDPLSIRFLQLFDLNLDIKNNVLKHTMEYAAAYCNYEGFFALFGFKFDQSLQEFQSSKVTDLFKIKDSTG